MNSCLTLAQRRGTIDAYQSKWSVYHTWCGKQGVHPVFPTLPKLVDFLNYLFTETKLSVSAITCIKGYKSAIATSLRLIGCLLENVLARHVYDCSKEYVSSTLEGRGPFLGSQSSYGGALYYGKGL
jgi:hypothetical protein